MRLKGQTYFLSLIVMICSCGGIQSDLSSKGIESYVIAAESQILSKMIIVSTPEMDYAEHKEFLNSVHAASGDVVVDLSKYGIYSYELLFESESDARKFANSFKTMSSYSFSNSYKCNAMNFVSNEPDWLDALNSSGLDYYSMWGQVKCNFEYGWEYGLSSSNIIVGIIDTGFNVNHEELIDIATNLETSYPGVEFDVVQDDSVPDDGDGHGTFISFIARFRGRHF